MAQPTFNPAAQFSLLTNANTFQDWLTTTNSLVQQNNDLAANNFFKNTGTLYLNDSTLALSTNSSVTLGGTTTINSAVVTTLRTTGNFIVSGNTLYQSNNFLLNSSSGSNINGSFGVYRPQSASNSAIRWNESGQYWDILDVNNSIPGTQYSQILTANLVSSSLLSTSTTTIASSNTVNALFSLVSTTSANASNSFTGTTGTAKPVNGAMTLLSNNGISIVGSGNTIYFNTQQDLRNTASPTFASLSLTAPLGLSQGGTGANTAVGALNAILPQSGQISGYALSTNGAGTYYWGPGGGGNNSNGNTIITRRTYYTATSGQTIFTGTSPYVLNSGQLRVYINGVRNYATEYTETSTTSFALNSGATAGDSIMAEVDAYTSAIFANTIPYTVNQQISTQYTTIQSAIDGTLVYANAAYTLANTTANTVTSTLSTISNAQFGTLGIGTTGDTANTGSIRATGDITAFYSDDNLKNRLGTIDNALDKLCSLTGFFYEPNEKAIELGYPLQRHVGVSAQDTQKVLPEIVKPAPISDRYLTVQYDKFAPLIIEAIKELRAEVEELKGRIK